MHKVWCCLGEVPYCFSTIITFKTWKTRHLCPLWELPCPISCFSRLSVKFTGHTAKRIIIFFTQIGCFQTVTPVWIHRWLWNDAQSLMWHRRCALLFFKGIHQISRSQGAKKSPILTQIGRFRTVTPVWIHWSMDLKWCTKLEAAYKRCLIVFQGQPPNFKVAQDKKSPILTRIECFQTATPVWIHWSMDLKMMHKAWRTIEEMPYCFSRSSIKFQGHTGWKIYDFNPISVRLLGWSQLSNPGDLPCLFRKLLFLIKNFIEICSWGSKWL